MLPPAALILCTMRMPSSGPAKPSISPVQSSVGVRGPASNASAIPRRLAPSTTCRSSASEATQATQPPYNLNTCVWPAALTHAASSSKRSKKSRQPQKGRLASGGEGSRGPNQTCGLVVRSGAERDARGTGVDVGVGGGVLVGSEAAGPQPTKSAIAKAAPALCFSRPWEFIDWLTFLHHLSANG